MDRRTFLQATGTAALAGVTSRTPSALAQAPANTPQPSKRLKKALKIGMVQGDMPLVEKFKMLKELGFEGIELDAPSDLKRDEVIKARDESGLPIPGVVDSVHWKMHLGHPDTAIRKKGLDGLLAALEDAKAYGSSTVLLVPAVVNKEISYADAYKRSQEEIRKALPRAHELGVKIAIENVWNQFLLSPLEAARYIDEFESPDIGFHFDIGNIVNYGWPEHWIRILGKRILKLDVKEFSRKRRDNEGLWKGFDVPLGEGDCDWPAVMKALADIGYRGWAAAEVPGGGREKLADLSRRMDRIFQEPAA